jgi:hypothetical protein
LLLISFLPLSLLLLMKSNILEFLGGFIIFKTYKLYINQMFIKNSGTSLTILEEPTLIIIVITSF